jgi:hypothetical protein
VPQVTLPQAEPPVQVALPPPVPNVRLPQLFEPRHVSTQCAVLLQVMLPHALVLAAPSHSTVQLPAAQLMFPHAFGAPHVMSHDSELVQWMSPHAPPVEQPIMQCQPAGHVIVPLPRPVTLQVCVAKLHAVPGHTLGHTAASGGASGGPSMCASMKLPTTQ